MVSCFGIIPGKTVHKLADSYNLMDDRASYMVECDSLFELLAQHMKFQVNKRKEKCLLGACYGTYRKPSDLFMKSMFLIFRPNDPLAIQMEVHQGLRFDRSTTEQALYEIHSHSPLTSLPEGHQ